MKIYKLNKLAGIFGPPQIKYHPDDPKFANDLSFMTDKDWEKLDAANDQKRKEEYLRDQEQQKQRKKEENPPPTNIQELRRYLKPGKKLKLTFHANPKAQSQIGQIRTIVSNRLNEIGMLTGENVSYLPISDSDAIKFQCTPTGFNVIDKEGQRTLMAYEYAD